MRPIVAIVVNDTDQCFLTGSHCILRAAMSQAQAKPFQILQAVLLCSVCFEYTSDYLSYTHRVVKKSVKPVWQNAGEEARVNLIRS